MTIATSIRLRALRHGLGSALLYAVLVASPADARPGDVDPSFGLGGFVITDFGADEGASDVAVQPDGKIVAVGVVSDDFTVARYNADGSPDAGFGGGDGQVETGFGADESATSVAIRPDGRIVVGGFTEAGPSPPNFALARYRPDGALDLSFDGDGLTFTDFGGEDAATDVELMPDGRVVAAGQSITGLGTNDFAVARYLANGTPDNSFSGDGLQTVDFGALDVATDMELQGDGAVVAAGASGTGGSYEVAVARLDATGALDPSFSGDGRQTTALGEVMIANAVALQPDGRILVSGDTASGGSGDFAIFRYDAGGTLDPSFGAGGVVTRDLGDSEGSSDVAVQPDGKIVAQAGDAFGLARFDAGGNPDPGFGNGGFAPLAFDGLSTALAIALQPDGRIVAAGITEVGQNPNNFGLARVFGGEQESPPAPSICSGRAATILAAPGKRTKGTEGDDVIVGTSKRDRVNAGPGDDTVCTLAGRSRVKAGPGSDVVIGGGRKDVLSGQGGRDRLRGKGGNDRLRGGPGADRLVGGKGRRDRCAGGPGRDRSRGC